jgi:tryptophan synthase alpha chain
MRTSVQERVKDLLVQMRSITDKPIGIGFGISSGSQARQIKDWGADTVIVGSAFVKQLAIGGTQGLQAVGELCRELKQAITPEPVLSKEGQIK